MTMFANTSVLRKSRCPALAPFAAIAAVFVAGCSSGSGENLDANGQPLENDVVAEAESPPVEQPPVIDPPVESPEVVVSVFSEIQSTVFSPICAECHGAGFASAGLNLAEGSSFAEIVGVPSTQVLSLIHI